MPARSRLRAEADHAGDGCRVTEFNMAGSDYTAGCQHVQGGSFLLFVHSAKLYILERGREGVHRVFLLCWGDAEVSSHPEYATQVFI